MPSRPFGSTTTLAIAVGLCALVLAVADIAPRYVPHTWIQRDGRFYANVNATIVEKLSLDQSEFCASWYDGRLGWNRNLDAAWSNVALGSDGTRLPKHPFLLAVLSTPLFWAFGLIGTLIFNLLLFFVIGGAGFALAKRYGSNAAAAFASLALIFASGVREQIYDYHVDVLMLALITSGLALLHARRGLFAGVLFGMMVMLRPTALLFVPSFALIVAQSRDWRTLKRALIGGAIPMVWLALQNTVLYGAPWWTGYNRTLIVVDGIPQLADPSTFFDVPFQRGLETLWSGPYGISTRLPLFFFAVPGLVCLLRKKSLYVLAAIVGAIGPVLVFATYRWYGDRFLWPCGALLLPALAVSFDVIARLVRRHPSLRPPVIAALGSIAILLVHALVGPGLEQRIAEGTIPELALNVAVFSIAAGALTRAAQRAGAGTLAVLPPLALLFLPGVRDRVVTGGPDLYFATAVCLSLAARHWIVALVFAASAAAIGATSADPIPPWLLLERLGEPAARPIVILIVLAALALPFLRRWTLLLAPLLALAAPSVAGLGAEKWPLFALALLCLPRPFVMARAAGVAWSSWRAAPPSRRALAIGTTLAALFVAGLVPRLAAPPLRIASYEGVRRAEVSLGEVPCDFLAWEHLNWECSNFDNGVHGETGLATSQPLHVAGGEAPAFLISTQRGRSRSVLWRGVPATASLVLRYAVPDELAGGGVLFVRVNGRQLTSFVLARERDGLFHRERIDTRRFRGRRVTLELELVGLGTGVLVDGGFVH